MATIQITEPTGSFLVTIKNSSGTTVYSDTQDNTPFDPGITDPDDYIIYVDNGGAVNGFCWTITGCECPVLDSAVITLEEVTYYGEISFDMSGGFGCPFQIYVETAFSTGILYINSLSDFTSNVGDIYTKKFIIGGVGDLYYRIELADGTICVDGYISYECEPVTLGITTDGKHFYLLNSNPVTCLGTWTLQLIVDECGVTCNTYTVNYLQVNALVSGVPDSGTYSATASCVNSPAITLNPYTVSPNLDIVGFDGCDGITPIYNVTYTDCCGNSFTETIEYTA